MLLKQDKYKILNTCTYLSIKSVKLNSSKHPQIRHISVLMFLLLVFCMYFALKRPLLTILCML